MPRYFSASLTKNFAGGHLLLALGDVSVLEPNALASGNWLTIALRPTALPACSASDGADRTPIPPRSA